jgi:hypothetical protein
VGDDGYWRALQLSGLAEGLTRSRRHPAIRTTHLCHCILECGVLTGT